MTCGHGYAPFRGSLIDAGERRGGGHRGRAEVDLGVRVAHAALEVAVGGGERHLAVAERALVDAEAGAAAGVHDHGARPHQVEDVALVERLLEDAAGGGEDEHAGALRHLLAAQDVRGGGDVVEAAVGAGADDDLVDLRAGDRVDRLHVVHGVRAGDLRREGRSVDLDHALVDGVRVGVHEGDRVRDARHLAQVAHRLLVAGDDAGGGAGLDRHVAQDEAAGGGHRPDRLAVELDDAEVGALGGEEADEVEDQVLGADVRRRSGRRPRP